MKKSLLLLLLFTATLTYGQQDHKTLLTILADSAGVAGVNDATGDYSGGDTVYFRIQPPAGERWAISRLIFSLEDAGSIDSGGYGNGVALTNGIEIRVRQRSEGDRYLLTPFPVLTNAEWAMLCHDLTRHDFGSGNEVLSGRWTFTKHGYPIVLNGTFGDNIEIMLKDDFTNLVHHYFLFEGYKL